jgi:hypothetical protein
MDPISDITMTDPSGPSTEAVQPSTALEEFGKLSVTELTPETSPDKSISKAPSVASQTTFSLQSFPEKGQRSVLPVTSNPSIKVGLALFDLVERSGWTKVRISI